MKLEFRRELINLIVVIVKYARHKLSLNNSIRLQRCCVNIIWNGKQIDLRILIKIYTNIIKIIVFFQLLDIY